jgi:twitching motility two-component system response regulator PilH
LARKILLADDSVTAQNMGRKILTEAGYEVVTVNNGSAALKKISEDKPDLIVLDVYMPGYGGLEVCHRIKETPETARIPVLLSVGKLEPFRADESRKAGADAYIVKPFEASELLTAISKLEDKIVPKGQAKKWGRSGKPAVADSDSELRNDWKDRLPIPIAKGKKRATQGQVASDSDEADGNGSAESNSAESVSGEFRSTESRLEDSATLEVSSSQAAASEPETTGPANQPVAEAEASATFAPPIAEPQTVQPKSAQPEPPSAMQDAFMPQTAAVAESTTVTGAEIFAGEAVSKTPNFAEQEVADALAFLGPSLMSGSVMETLQNAERTMRDQAASGPRWVADEVAVTADESSCVLEREMEKAYAAMAASATPQMDAVSAPAETLSSLSAPDSYSAETYPANPYTASAAVEPHDLLVSELVTSKSTAQVASSAISTTEAVAAEEEITEKKIAEEKFTEENPTGMVATDVKQIAAYAAAAGAESFDQIANPSTASAATVEGRSSGTGPVPSDLQPEPQLAEAWTNWQHIRESVLGAQLASLAPETSSSQSTAVPSDQPAAPPQLQPGTDSKPDEASAIANIVDSVLADLRPKLMEEIARKMAADKK